MLVPAKSPGTRVYHQRKVGMSTQTENHRDFFFLKFGLTQQALERYLSERLSAGGDYADLYFEYHTSSSLSVDESLVKSAAQGISAGCGVRVLSGDRTGYAYTDDLSPERILKAARTAALIASGPAKSIVEGFKTTEAPNLYPVVAPTVDADFTDKLDLVMRADRSARANDPRIIQVRASFADQLRRILVVGSDGVVASDSQPLCRFNVMVIAKDGDQSAHGVHGGGGRVSLEYFLLQRTPEYFAEEAERQALVNLDAVAAPAAEMEVVPGPGWHGILRHEAVGR